MNYILLDIELGQMGLVCSSKGLLCVVLPLTSKRAVMKRIKEGYPEAIADNTPFGDLPQRLRLYFAGEQVSFDDKLDLCGTSPFRGQVWNATRAIPYGETKSYGWIANRIGKPGAMRAVGQALSKNPFPIIVPCHRVIGKDGSLTGFEGGLELKRRLLEIEALSRNTM